MINVLWGADRLKSVDAIYDAESASSSMSHSSVVGEDDSPITSSQVAGSSTVYWVKVDRDIALVTYAELLVLAANTGNTYLDFGGVELGGWWGQSHLIIPSNLYSGDASVQDITQVTSHPDVRTLSTGLNWDWLHYTNEVSNLRLYHDVEIVDFFVAGSRPDPVSNGPNESLELQGMVWDTLDYISRPYGYSFSGTWADWFWMKVELPNAIFSPLGDTVNFNNLSNEQIALLPYGSLYASAEGVDVVQLPNVSNYNLPGGQVWNNTALFYAGDGNDIITGGDGSDFISGGSGNDTISGGSGNPTGRDMLIGDAGDDLFYGGPGNDTLQGREGQDTFEFRNADFTAFASNTLQTIDGGVHPGPLNDYLPDQPDTLLLPGNAADYLFITTGSNTRITHAETGVAFNTSGVERVRFAGQFDNAAGMENTVAEMLQLSIDAYPGGTWLDRDWHPLSAMELGLLPTTTAGGITYTMNGGSYNARAGSIGPEASAIIGVGIVDGLATLSIAFRGTDISSWDPLDWFDFQAHYDKFDPLIEAVDTYIAENNIQQVLVTGHSMGASMVQLFMAEHTGSMFKGFTIASPGIHGGVEDSRIVNFIHTDDPIVWAGAIKTIAGSEVYINTDISPFKALLLEHFRDGYAQNLTRVMDFAQDTASPFSRSALGLSLAAGEIYSGSSVQIAVGRYGSEVVNSYVDDDFVLGSAANDVIRWHGLGGYRIIDGGTGEDKLVLPGVRAYWDWVAIGGSSYSLSNFGIAAAELCRVEKLVFFFSETDLASASASASLKIGDDYQTAVASSAVEVPVVWLDGRAATVQRPSEGETSITVSNAVDYVDVGNGNYTISGSGADDIILLGTGSQVVTGGAGADLINGARSGGGSYLTVTGGGGDDRVGGSSGAQLTVVFSGTVMDYVGAAQLDGSLIVADIRAGSPDGTDTLSQATYLQFADGTYTVEQFLALRTPNVGPAEADAIEDVAATVDVAFAFTVPSGTFIDDHDTALTYSASLANGSPLPSWLTFDASTGTFAGQPSGADVGELLVLLRATDNGGESGSTAFRLAVNPSVPVTRAHEMSSSDSGTFTAPSDDHWHVTGTAAADTITTRAGNDSLNGGSGADRMTGGSGDDRFYIDDSGDVVMEVANEGDDIAFVLGTYTLAQGASVETLYALNTDSTDPLVLTGNEFGQSLYGNQGDNYLNGGAGADYLVGLGGNDSLLGGAGADWFNGGLGNDVYYVEQTGDQIIEAANEGDDILVATASYVLSAGVHIETMTTEQSTAPINLTGNELAQSLYGNAGNNDLTGGGGADYLVGGLGNDRYFVDNSDFVAEGVGGGDDTIFVADTYILREGAEIETLVAVNQDSTAPVNLAGNEYGQSLYGSQGDNYLNGNAGNDYLVGLGGNDSLIGGAGADWLEGGSGNDVYYAVDAADSIIESAGQGEDIVVATTSYALASGVHVETLSAADGAAINLTGNAFAQSLYGNAAANVLSSGGGADYLVGGAGNDTFVISSLAMSGAGNIATIGDYAAGEIVDITQILNVAGGTDLVAGGYLKVAGGQLQVDTNGGGDSWTTIANVSGSAAVTVRYLAGGSASELSVARSAAQTAMMAGAVAAAGMAAIPAAAKAPDEGGAQISDFAASSFAIRSIETSDPGLAAASWMELSGETREAIYATSADSTNLAAYASIEVRAYALATPDAAQPAALPQGTDVPATTEPLAHALVADGVVMPSAEMLDTINQGNGVEDVQDTAEVARVLLDALAGDDSGPNLDALLDAVAGQTAVPPALAQFAGHAGWVDGFVVAYEAFSMEAFVIHQDALPQA